jgi:hypothetical protein
VQVWDGMHTWCRCCWGCVNHPGLQEWLVHITSMTSLRQRHGIYWGKETVGQC